MTTLFDPPRHAGHLLVQCLVAQGVTHAFGVPGESYLAALDGFPVTDKPASGEGKRAPRDKQANRRTQGKRSIKQFKGKA